MLTVDEFNARMKEEIDTFLRIMTKLIDEFNEDHEISAMNRTQVLLFTVLNSCHYLIEYMGKVADSYMEGVITAAKEIKKELDKDET